jgi:hypothetical protein
MDFANYYSAPMQPPTYHATHYIGLPQQQYALSLDEEAQLEGPNVSLGAV